MRALRVPFLGSDREQETGLAAEREPGLGAGVDGRGSSETLRVISKEPETAPLPARGHHQGQNRVSVAFEGVQGAAALEIPPFEGGLPGAGDGA